MRTFPLALIALGGTLPALLGGCSAITSAVSDPYANEGDGLEKYPEEVQYTVNEVDKLQSKGYLREAIDMVERKLVDYPNALILKDRLGELRSQRQVCFVEDLTEADALVQQRSPSMALLKLQRIERYGDGDMIRRAHEKMAEIRSRHPNL